jgi:NADH-quinone oxidoreductase subunit J
MTTILFGAFGLLAVACALLVILHKNPVTSALFLVLTFCSLAGLYLLLQAEFLAMVQVIVYAGAIMVLFLFVIMYLNLDRDVDDGVPFALRRWTGWAVGLLLLVETAVLLWNRWGAGPEGVSPPAALGNTAAVGQILYTRYLFPFELTSILLIVAIIGAVMLGKGRTAPPGSEGVPPQ